MKHDVGKSSDVHTPAARESGRRRKRSASTLDHREIPELLLAHIADVIILAEADGRIIDANPAACAMLGYARIELLGRHPWDFVTSASRAEITKLMRELEPEAPVTVRRTFRKKTGEQGTMELRLTRFGRDLFAVSCRNLTEHVRLQEQLRDFEADSARSLAEIRNSEARLRRSEANLAEAQKLSHTGSVFWRPSTGENQVLRPIYPFHLLI